MKAVFRRSADFHEAFGLKVLVLLRVEHFNINRVKQALSKEEIRLPELADVCV